MEPAGITPQVSQGDPDGIISLELVTLGTRFDYKFDCFKCKCASLTTSRNDIKSLSSPDFELFLITIVQKQKKKKKNQYMKVRLLLVSS